MFKLPATLTIHVEQPYIKNLRTPTDVYSLTLITLATTSLLLPRTYVVETHISKVTDKRIQHSEIKEVLSLNGFPTKFSSYKKAYKHTPADSQHSFSAFTTLPYIQGVSDKIQRVLNSVEVKVALKPLLTIDRWVPFLS